MTTSAHNLTHRRDLASLAVCLLVCFAVYGLGGAVTASSVGIWYQTLDKPSFNPPDWVFAPVWFALFAMMAISAWRVWRRAGRQGARAPLVLFVVQLALNLGWSTLFFGLRNVGAALVEVTVLLAAVVATTVLFWRIDRWAGALFVPYIAWTAFAVVLNAAIWRLN